MHGSESFSERFGFKAPDAEITIREAAPEPVRDAIIMLAYAADLRPKAVRDLVCEVLLKRQDPNNWSDANVEYEVRGLVDEAPWYKIYDLAERVHREIAGRDFSGVVAPGFERRLNQLFREQGVGWKLENGQIMVRGSDAFELATAHAAETMRTAGAPTAANEMHEALKDISRRPVADVTGAIQHAMAALECVARDYSGSTDTLGSIIGQLPVPKPLDGALHKLWGFTSNEGRHLLEGKNPGFEEAELVVTMAAAVSTYLVRFRSRTNGGA